MTFSHGFATGKMDAIFPILTSLFDPDSSQQGLGPQKRSDYNTYSQSSRRGDGVYQPNTRSNMK